LFAQPSLGVRGAVLVTAFDEFIRQITHDLAAFRFRKQRSDDRERNSGRVLDFAR
jgi:hypothetical protein